MNVRIAAPGVWLIALRLTHAIGMLPPELLSAGTLLALAVWGAV
jgi:hypothetical protein